jgi:hypothetical protein
MIDLNWLNEYVSLIPSAAGDVRLRAKADRQRIRNRVRDLGRSDHRDVNVRPVLPRSDASGLDPDPVLCPAGPRKKAPLVTLPPSFIQS